MNLRGSLNNRFLLDAGLAPATQRKYSIAVELFVNWCDENHLQPQSFDHLDELLTDYLHELYITYDGSMKSLASETLYGILTKIPRARGNLQTAQQCVKNWHKLHPSQSYPPLTWDLTVLIAVHMVRHDQLRAGIATLLAFDCFLRVGELVELRGSDVADIGDSRLGSGFQGVALRIRKAKTGKNQWVEVDHTDVRKLVQMLKSSTSAESRLFPFSAAEFRTLFKNSCAELRLSSSYVPHSLRHGGATKWHLDGKPVNDIVHRDRWASTKSATRYIQSGRALLLNMNHPTSITNAARVLSRRLLHFINLSLPQQH